MARLIDLAADGDMAGALVRGKLAELEAEQACIRAELATATATKPKPGAVAEAIQRALSASCSAALRFGWRLAPRATDSRGCWK